MGRKRLIHGFFWDLSLSSVSLPLSTAAYAGPALAGGPARRLPRVDVKCSIYGCYSMTDGLETPRKLCRFAELRPTLMSGDSPMRLIIHEVHYDNRRLTALKRVGRARANLCAQPLLVDKNGEQLSMRPVRTHD